MLSTAAPAATANFVHALSALPAVARDSEADENHRVSQRIADSLDLLKAALAPQRHHVPPPREPMPAEAADLAEHPLLQRTGFRVEDREIDIRVLNFNADHV